MGVFQIIFSVSDHFRGRPVASLRPSLVGPRQSGQLAKVRLEYVEKTTKISISHNFQFNFTNFSFHIVELVNLYPLDCVIDVHNLFQRFLSDQVSYFQNSIALS